MQRVPILIWCPIAVAFGCQPDPASWDSFLLRPWAPSDQTPAALGLAYEDLRIPSSEGKLLAAWFVPAQTGAARGTFLIHTSMEGNLGRYIGLLPTLTESEFNVFIYDWQGFGASEGSADFRNFEADTWAAVDYLRTRREPSARKWVHLGLSLGTLPATAIAAQTPDETAGLILYGPFFPEQLPASWISQQMSPVLAPFGTVAGSAWGAILPPFMRPANYVGSVSAPCLVITPDDDESVPPAQQQAFFDALPDPKEHYFTHGGHSRAPFRDPSVLQKVVSWSEQLPSLSASPD